MNLGGKGFLWSSGTSVVGGSTAALREPSKKLLPQKDIIALVFVTGGGQRWPDEEDEGSIPGLVQPRVQGTRWQRSGGGRMCEVLTGAATGVRASVWGNFVPRGPVLLWVPGKWALRFRPGCYFRRAWGPGGKNGGRERGQQCSPTLAAGGNRPDIGRADLGGPFGRQVAACR